MSVLCRIYGFCLRDGHELHWNVTFDQRAGRQKAIELDPIANATEQTYIDRMLENAEKLH